MAGRVTAVTPEELRARIAAAILDRSAVAERLGRIKLHPHQLAAITRVQRALHEFGGALLADAVGLGKTYVALAVARAYSSPVVVAPAVLRATWADSARAANTIVQFVSTESLSRRDPDVRSDFVIVDEAHHFRTATTHRYARLAELCATTPILLLSATPIHNRSADLNALLALFLGSRAQSLTGERLSLCVIRREHTDVPELGLPRVRNTERICAGGDPHIADAIMSLAPPLPLKGGRAATALVRLGLLELLASSVAALRTGVRRRLAAGTALREALQRGRFPSRRELGAWLGDTESIQLTFAELVVETRAAGVGEAFAALDRHLDELRALLTFLDASPDGDGPLCATLRAIRASHRDARIVAFSAYEATVRGLYRLLAADGAVAAVSGSGGWIASGRVDREEVLRMFRAPSHTREGVQLLLATDLLSEGLNLPQASVVVHLDLPWTAARLEQRLGRMRRPGQRSREITSYVFSPRSAVEQLLRKELRIAIKADTAARTVGTLMLSPEQADVISPARAGELTRNFVAGWIRPHSEPGAQCIVAAVRAECDGFVAVLEGTGGERLACALGANEASFDPRAVYAALRRAGGPAASVSAQDYRLARRALERLIRGALQRSSIGDVTDAPVIVTATRRLRATLAQAPAHERSALAGRVAVLNSRLAGRLTAGLELRLQRLLSENEADIVAECERLLAGAAKLNDVRVYQVKAVLLLVRADQRGRPAAKFNSRER